MTLMEVIGDKLAGEGKDASGKITLSIWKFQIPTPENHPTFQVNVKIDPGEDWVCIGGGATGSANPGNLLTTSCPSLDVNGKEDWKGWRVASRDHEVADPCKLVGFAIGMKVDGLNRDELIPNLKMFTDVGMPVSHPDVNCYVEDGYLLLGGGFDVLDQPEGGGNMASASFPDSTFSWRARSQDRNIPTPSRLRVFAIGISLNLMKPNPNGSPTSIGNVATTFASFESSEIFSIGNARWTAARRPLPGYALCGGGANAHFGSPHDYHIIPKFLWNLVPMIEVQPPPTSPDQTFTGEWTYLAHGAEGASGSITAYAMGIKFKPAAEPGPGPAPGPECNKRIRMSNAISSGSQNTYPPTNAIDGNPNTKWWSTFIPNPWIRLELGGQKPVCRVDIVWADAIQFHFNISVSSDGSNFTDVLTGIISTGNTPATESYSFPVTSANYIKITITQSTQGSPNSIAQISEISVFSNA
jgi:F5/8 type C domain-containing protein